MKDINEMSAGASVVKDMKKKIRMMVTSTDPNQSLAKIADKVDKKLVKSVRDIRATLINTLKELDELEKEWERIEG